MAVHPLRPATDRRLGGPLPRQLANQTRGHLSAHKALTAESCDPAVSCGISSRFQLLSPTERQVPHALLTRSPLSRKPKLSTPFDLHVLGTPPAFVLSQDQTLVNMVTVRTYFFSLCLPKSAFASLKPSPIHQVLLSRFALPSRIYTSHRFKKILLTVP